MGRTERAPRIAVWLPLALAACTLVGAGLLLLKHSVDTASAARYRAATRCESVASTLADDHCFALTTATVTGKSTYTSRGGRHFGLDLDVDGLSHQSVSLAGCRCGSLYDAVSAGDRVTVKVWRGDVTLLTRGRVEAATFRNPNFETGDDVRAAIILGLLGGFLVLEVGIVQARRRRPPVPVTGPDLEPAPGAVGAPAGFGQNAQGVWTYRLIPSGALAPVSFGVPIVAASTITAMSIQPSVASVVAGALAGALIAGLVVVLMRDDRIEVGPDGLNWRGRFRRLTLAWPDVVSVRVERRRGFTVVGRCTTEHRAPRVRRISLASYMRNPANRTLPRAVETYWRRAVEAGATPVSAARADGPFALELAGFGVRAAAWFADALIAATSTFVVAIVLDIIPATTGHANAFGGAAFVLALVLVVPGYAIVSWRRGSTVAMRALGLRVVRVSDRSPLSWRRAALRFLAALPSIVLVIPIGLIPVSYRKDRLAWHDRLAATAVVRSRARSVSVLADPQAPRYLGGAPPASGAA
jgi:uncharacterized RDD family membrane protein YckC